MADLGRTLRRLRKCRRMSIYDVEKRTGLHFSTISKYERNERLPSLQVLKELAGLYGVPLGSLVAEEKPGDVPPDLLVRVRLLMQRHDLIELLELAERLSPEQVGKVVEMIRALAKNQRPRRPAAE